MNVNDFKISLFDFAPVMINFPEVKMSCVVFRFSDRNFSPGKTSGSYRQRVPYSEANLDKSMENPMLKLATMFWTRKSLKVTL